MRILVLTLPPFDGGVPFKARQLCQILREYGHDVTVATYATFHHHPNLNWSLRRLGQGDAPACLETRCFEDAPADEGFRALFVGCWLPELEVTYTLPSRRWSKIIQSFDRHVAVGGTSMIAHPLAALGLPYLLWCASDVAGDRKERQSHMGWVRRLLDKAIISPWLWRNEGMILRQSVSQVRASQVRGVSQAAVANLQNRGCASDRLAVLPIPVDLDQLAPPSQPPRPGIIGFAGRFNDPRKNIGLLVTMMALAKAQGLAVELYLAGAVPTQALLTEIREAGLEDRIHCVGELSRAELMAFYRQLDIFVIPSHQEGLCISGIEAMACGVPVITTPCGGPADYVIDGETGFVASTATTMLQACERLFRDRELRHRLSATAEKFVRHRYSIIAFKSGLAEAWAQVWGEQVLGDEP